MAFFPTQERLCRMMMRFKLFIKKGISYISGVFLGIFDANLKI